VFDVYTTPPTAGSGLSAITVTGSGGSTGVNSGTHIHDMLLAQADRLIKNTVRTCEPHFSHKCHRRFWHDENHSSYSSGDETMRVALQVNIALWGMILCAAAETAEQFLGFF
jgi:hypothetical protein